jgi:uncharacterized protein YabN with tetrapyrrole methylase and pyrophosphatase domain
MSGSPQNPVHTVANNITNNNPVNNTAGDLNKNIPLNYLHSAFQPSFTNIKLKNTTTGEIRKIIKELKCRRSCGFDGITTEILKISGLLVVSPLTYIM